MAEDLTLRPNAAGDYSEGDPSGYDKVDEVVADEDVTYVQALGTDPAVSKKELYNLPDSEIEGSINSVTLYVRGRIGAAAVNNFSHCYGYAKINGTYYQVISISSLTYATGSKTWITNPKTGVAWTWNDIDQLQVGVRLYAWNGGCAGAFYARCTQVYVVVNYNSPPTVTTQDATEKGQYIATLNGNITVTGGDNATVRGFEYKIGEDGDVITTTENGDFGTGAFTKNVIDLVGATLYKYRAYAINVNGTGYGDWVEFTTDDVPPTVTTQEATEIAPNQVKGNGTITNTGGENCTERGFEYGLTKTNTSEVHDTGDYGAEPYTKTIDDLSPNTQYWYRAYAKNTVDPFYGYGEWKKFQTSAAGTTPTGTGISICSDYSGYTYILNESLTDDGNDYESYFILSTDLMEKQGLHLSKRLEDLFSYFEKKDSGTCKIYVKRDNETEWQYAGQISMIGDADIIIKHLPSENQDSSGDVDFLAKHFSIKFVFQNDFDFIGLISEFIIIGVR